MKWFKKNKKEEEDNSVKEFDDTDTKEFKKGSINRASYRIVIYEGFNSVPRKVMEFMATRVVDDEDYIPYLKYTNPKTKKEWMEIFPQKVQDFINYDEKQIKVEIEKCETKIEKIRKQENTTDNIKDWQFKLIKLKAKQRALKISQNSSYISLDENNMPTVFYKREGSNFFPFKWDLDTDTILVPSDNKKKNASIVFRNKDAKYPSRENQVRIATMVMFIVSALMAVAAGFLFYKAGENYSENELNNIREQQLQDIQRIQRQFEQQGLTLQTILNNMSANIIIAGVPSTSSDSKPIDLGKE